MYKCGAFASTHPNVLLSLKQSHFVRFVFLVALLHYVLPCFQVISAIIVKLSCCTTVIQMNI